MKKSIFFLLSLLVAGFTSFSQQDVGLLRFPAVYNDQVVFSYAGDLYTVALAGGTARRLTAYEAGYEMFPRFSPDGKTIAFTGQYDGNTEVFTIPAQGGIPVRLTYTATLNRDDISDRMGPNNIVMTWSDNDHIVYRSRKQTFNDFKGQLFKVSANGGLSEELPLPSGGFCSFSPDGSQMAYNRVFREFRTWKYYEGGMADDIWIYDFAAKTVTNITNNDNQNIFPMWYGNKIYFLSDRDRTMNLFVYDFATKQTTKLTNYTNYDIKFPSLGNKSIVYENGGFLYNYDLASGAIAKIVVNISNDLLTGRDEFKDASKYINSYAVSPDGKRVAFGARGEIFTVPAETGITRNLTNSSGVHDRNVEWSPDGKWISFVSDMNGENEIYIENQNGLEKPVQLTFGSDTYKYNPIWSPDSKMLLWSDKMGRLSVVDVNSKKVKVIVEDSEDWEISEYSWSPDSRFIAYTLPKNSSVSVVMVYDNQSGETHQITDNWYNAGSPCFDNNGNYLFFSSARDFNPIYSWTEWNHAYQDMNAVYFVTLQASTPNPFQPKNDEVKVQVKSEPADPAKDKKGKDKAAETTDETAVKPVKIDFEGISNRVLKLNVKAGNYWNLNVVGNSVYYVFNSASSGAPMLKTFDLTTQKEAEIGEFNSFLISADYSKMLVNDKGKYAVINLPKDKARPEKYLDLTGMNVMIDLNEEWAQIYNESWSQMRDFFYAPNMHGVDWQAIHDKYAVLLPYVKNRNDLNYLIGEMIGELNVGHAYVLGGDKPAPKRIQTGLLGARLSKDASGYFVINEILPGENWVANSRSPLTEVGVDVKEGDYIIAVNEQSVKNVSDIYQLLVGTVNKQVLLTVNSKADSVGSHNVIVVPTADESGLYYFKWVRENIEKVSAATNGQVGYIHIPDMGPEGLNEFVKYFYPQLNKKALIIDDRGNGGGNVSPMIIERLNRELTLYGMSRNNSVTTKPEAMILGPKVMLIDNYSASDGDLFPYQFKKLKMGTVIGLRSWGGVVGIRGSLPFVDGGDLRKPEFAPFDTDGKWAIEGYGVDPDIVVDNDPAKEYAGEDQQLNKAIEVILEQMKSYPPVPAIPPYPDKTK